jgi:hypothetical protein
MQGVRFEKAKRSNQLFPEGGIAARNIRIFKKLPGQFNKKSI